MFYLKVKYMYQYASTLFKESNTLWTAFISGSEQTLACVRIGPGYVNTGVVYFILEWTQLVVQPASSRLFVRISGVH